MHGDQETDWAAMPYACVHPRLNAVVMTGCGSVQTYGVLSAIVFTWPFRLYLDKESS